MDRNSETSDKRNTRATWRNNVERGQGLVEYALGLVLVGMTASVSLAVVGPSINEALCEVVETVNPSLMDDCASGEGSEEELTGGSSTILFAKYNAGKGELDVQAKAPDSCAFDLQIMVDGVPKGTMIRQGDSYVFKYTESPTTPPTTVQVGHPDCGGFSTQPVG